MRYNGYYLPCLYEKGHMAEIEYTVTDRHGLDLIAPLWRKLLEHHAGRSIHFSEQMAAMTYEERKNQLIEKSHDGELRIDLAHDKEADKLIGYCIGTISEDRRGEVESIYVEPDYRRAGVADIMLRRCLAWMEEKSVRKKVLVIAVGNEEVMPLYERHAFFPRAIIMEQVEDG